MQKVGDLVQRSLRQRMLELGRAILGLRSERLVPRASNERACGKRQCKPRNRSCPNSLHVLHRNVFKDRPGHRSIKIKNVLGYSLAEIPDAARFLKCVYYRKRFSATISTALVDSRSCLFMSTILSRCRNSDARCWVAAHISTTYWAAVLTLLRSRLTLGWSQPTARLSLSGDVDRCNHLSQYLAARFFGLGSLVSGLWFLLAPFLEQGDCCA